MATAGDNKPIIEVIHPSPDEAWKMPYVPAVSIIGACDLMFLSGCTPSKLYHNHPHIDSEHQHPFSIEEQTTLAMLAIKDILDTAGASFRDIVKMTKYLTDFRDVVGMQKALVPFMGDWHPASTTICVNSLSSPGARVELDCIVALPKKNKA